MYKLTRPDGTDFYSGTINYAENIGKIIRVTDYDPASVGVCGRGIHMSKNPNDCFIGSSIPCRAWIGKGIQRIAGDKRKSRYQAVKIMGEVEDLDALFGWKYSEAVNPIHPFKISPPEITENHIQLLKQWASVWDSVWDSVGASVGDSVWASVGAYIGSFFPNIKAWKHINHKKGIYPYQPCVDLWKQGLVSSYNNKSWRLHGGPSAKVLYKTKG